MTHVLIVEDHEENRTLLGMLLEANGYRVTVAGDGLEALAAARRDPPDVVVSDALMPNMDGFALCRAWMQDAALRPIPFIFYSATYVRPEEERFGRALGAVRYLIKPLEAEVFLGEVRAVLQQWAGHGAPGPASPLDDTAAHALHESALARKVEDKVAQLEAANRKLQESEARFRSLTEMSSDFYWESDAGHRLTQRASAAKKSSTISVFARGAQIGERRWDIPHLSPDETGWAAHRAVLEAHQPFREFELSRLGTDGTEHFISISGDPVFDASGVFTGYRGVGKDITDRKLAEEALTRENNRNRVFLHNASDGVHILDADGTVLEVSDSFCAMLGYSREELIGASVSLWDAQWSPQELKKIIARQIAKDGRSILETRHRRRDGSFLDVEVTGQGLELEGKPALFNSARDISERIRSEQLLVETEAQFRGLVEQSIAGTYIIQDGKYAYVNPRLAEIFGYGSADELIGRDASSMIAEKDRGTVAENMRRRIEGEIASINYDFTGLRKDGSMVDVGVHGARANHRGRPAVIGILQDISEKKRAEEQIQRYVAQIENAFMSTVQVVTTLGEMRDPYTAGHQRRVAEIAVAIGAELGFDARRQEGLRVAGYLHDVGKIRIPSEILSKPGKLNQAEFRLVQGHAEASYDVLKDVEFPWPVAEVALQHHERMDGSGYPLGLKGEAILLEARIMAVADVIEAMSSHRPYRAGLGIEAALSEIERGRGSAYDADIADACLKLFRKRNYAIPA